MIPLEVAVPVGVATTTWPLPGPETVVVRLVAVAAVIWARDLPVATTSLAVVVSNPVPVTVTVPPTEATPGEKLVIEGPAGPTVYDPIEHAVPPGAVTLIVPEVAPPGTVATIFVAVEETTVATVPLNLTVFCDGVALKPVP